MWNFRVQTVVHTASVSPKSASWRGGGMGDGQEPGKRNIMGEVEKLLPVPVHWNASKFRARVHFFHCSLHPSSRASPFCRHASAASLNNITRGIFTSQRAVYLQRWPCHRSKRRTDKSKLSPALLLLLVVQMIVVTQSCTMLNVPNDWTVSNVKITSSERINSPMHAPNKHPSERKRVIALDYWPPPLKLFVTISILPRLLRLLLLVENSSSSSNFQRGLFVCCSSPADHPRNDEWLGG